MPDSTLGYGTSGLTAGRQLRLFVATARQGWPVLLSGLLAGLLLALALLHLVAPRYTATMVVGPTARVGAAAMGARVPMLLGRELPMAIAEPGPGDEILSDFARYLELLAAPPIAERLLAEPGLTRALFPDRWDAEAGRWRLPPGVVPWLKRRFLGLAGREEWVEPDAERVARALQERLVVDMVRSGPMRRVSLRDVDREVALRLLARVAAATDAHLRAEAGRRNAAQIAHLRERLAAVTVAEHRRALAELLSEQERTAMMIDVDLPFAADLIVPPAAAQRPDWPNPATLAAVAALAGLAAGALFLSLRAVWRADVGGECL